MVSAPLLAGVPILAGGAGAAWLLRRSWILPIGERGPFLWSGWALLLASAIWPAWVLGSARGPFIAVTLISIAVLALIAAKATVRAAKPSRVSDSLAPEPLERPSTRWRGVLRWLLAGPIGMIAAMAIGIAYAVWVPGAPQTRLLIGGLIVPVVWGAAMAWTLADNRILRATAVLVGTAVLGFALSILRGFA